MQQIFCYVLLELKMSVSWKQNYFLLKIVALT